MEQRIRKGRINKVDGDRITIFNHDAQCEDTFTLFPQDAENIKNGIGLREEVFYLVVGNDLVEIASEGAVPDEVRMIHQEMPKDNRCLTAL